MHTFHAMNTAIGTLGLSAEQCMQVESWFRFVESRLSRFQSSSELSALNRAVGKPFLASALLFEVMTQADTYYQATDGLFHPYMGHVLCQLGYDQSFENIDVVYQKEWDKRNAKYIPAELNPLMRSIVLSPEVSVDLGGIAKGWSAQYMAQMLKESDIEAGAIDAGGDIVGWGNQEGGWEVAIEDPFHPEIDLLYLRIKQDFGIATSSRLKRRWKDAKGMEYNHILDPRRVHSTDSDLVQVTVLAPELTSAEVYAKCVLILGSKNGIAWLEQRKPDFGVIGIHADGSMVLGGNKAMYSIEGGTNNG